MPIIASPTGFDRKFVIAATLIGVAYAAIVAVLGAMFGREVAGAAGVALTALAAAIFKQFETLRFRAIADDEGTELTVPKIVGWRVAVFTGFFMGLKMVVGMSAGLIIAMLNLLPKVNDLTTFLSSIGSDWRAMAAIIFGNFVLYTLGGVVIAKGFNIRNYSTLLISAFLSCLIDTFLPLLLFMINDLRFFFKMLMAGALWPATFWLLYLAGTLLGARYAGRSIIQRLPDQKPRTGNPSPA